MQPHPPQLGRLDAEPGPARALSPAAAEARAQALLRKLRHKPKATRMGWWVAAACLVTLGAWASLAALQREPVSRAVQPTRQPQASATAPSRPPSQTPVAPIERDVRESAVPPAATAPAHAEAPATRASRDWLKLANGAREQRDYAHARELYLRARRAEPGSDQAYAAEIAAADLEREHLRDARSALRRYEAALRARPQGALAEQARVGRARAFLALGEREREAAAWRALLQAHPASWFAQEAEARLRELALTR